MSSVEFVEMAVRSPLLGACMSETWHKVVVVKRSDWSIYWSRVLPAAIASMVGRCDYSSITLKRKLSSGGKNYMVRDVNTREAIHTIFDALFTLLEELWAFGTLLMLRTIGCGESWFFLMIDISLHSITIVWLVLRTELKYMENQCRISFRFRVNTWARVELSCNNTVKRKIFK